MFKGIREFAQARFNQMLPKVRDMSARDFRKSVMDEIQSKFHVSVSSAATAYNYALQEARKVNPTSVATLGRAAAAQGGDKPAPANKADRTETPVEPPQAPQLSPDMVTIVKARSGEVVAVGVRRGFAEKFVTTTASGPGRGNAKLKIVEAAH